jgi:hypothetical protein
MRIYQHYIKLSITQHEGNVSEGSLKLQNGY